MHLLAEVHTIDGGYVLRKVDYDIADCNDDNGSEDEKGVVRHDDCPFVLECSA